MNFAMQKPKSNEKKKKNPGKYCAEALSQRSTHSDNKQLMNDILETNTNYAADLFIFFFFLGCASSFKYFASTKMFKKMCFRSKITEVSSSIHFRRSCLQMDICLDVIGNEIGFGNLLRSFEKLMKLVIECL